MSESTSTGDNWEGEAVGGSVLDGQFIPEGVTHEGSVLGGMTAPLTYDGQQIGVVHHNADGTYTAEVDPDSPFTAHIVGPSFSIMRKDGGDLPRNPQMTLNLGVYEDDPEPAPDRVVKPRDAE